MNLGVHFNQSQALQLRLAGEQEPRFVSGSVVQIELNGAGVHRIGHGPVPVVESPTGDLEFPVGHARQILNVVLDGRVENFPLLSRMGRRHSLYVAFGRVHDCTVDVRKLAFGQEFFLTRLQFHRLQSTLVAPATVEQVVAVSGLVKADRMRRHRILRFDSCELRPSRLRIRLQIEVARVGGEGEGEAYTVCVVAHEARETGILLNQRSDSAADVHTIDIVETGIPVVDPHENFLGKAGTDALDARRDLIDRGQIHDLGSIHVGPVNMPIFVTIGIL